MPDGNNPFLLGNIFCSVSYALKDVNFKGRPFNRVTVES